MVVDRARVETRDVESRDVVHRNETDAVTDGTNFCFGAVKDVAAGTATF